MCGICGKIDEKFLCNKCEEKINNIKCDKIDIYDSKNQIYNKHFYLFEYDDLIRKIIIDYKFNNCAYLYKTFEKILIKDVELFKFINSYDIIVPVPIHKNRKKERGYNQSALILKNYIKEINKKYNLKIIFGDDIIIKIKNTKKQSTLNKFDRELNIRDVYATRTESIKNIVNKKIIIFDDIYTTGNTVNECAKVLMRANAQKVDIVTLAKDK